MAKKKQSVEDILKTLAGGLKTAAIRPNIFGYEPHEKQQIFHSSTAKQKLFIGGNRSGKTVAGATEMIWWATGTHPFRKTPEPPVRLRAVSVDFLNGVEKIVKPEIAKWCPLSCLKGSSWETAYDKQLRTLNFENGSFLEFMSYDQMLDTFAGTSRHAIWFDEEPPNEVWQENKARLIDVGGSYWITMTPVEGMTWVYDDIYVPGTEGDGSNIFVVEVDMTENPHLGAGEVQEYISGLDADSRKARVQGKFVSLGGLIYKNFSIDRHVIPLFKPPKNWLHVNAMDHGWNNPTAWLWGAVNKQGQIFVYDEWYRSGLVVSDHAKKVLEKNAENQRIPEYNVGDPSIKAVNAITGTSVQLEYIEHGIPIVLGNNDVKAGIIRVGKYLQGTKNKRPDGTSEPDLYITENCVNLIREMRRYRWATWATKKMRFDKNKKEEPHKKDDHACDALRYLVASRPEIDTGVVVPDFNFDGAGYSVAVDPYNGPLAGVSSPGPRSSSVDYHMGEEY